MILRVILRGVQDNRLQNSMWIPGLAQKDHFRPKKTNRLLELLNCTILFGANCEYRHE